MQKRRLWYHVQSTLLAVVFAGGGAGTALAITSSSTNYQLTETQLGGGSTLQSCSDEYCARASIGDMAGGSSASSVHSASFGAITDGEPLLEVIVSPGESNLGVLTTEATATKTATVHIRNYLSGGYTLQVIGTPPRYGGHTLSAPSSPTPSTPGKEQFAINASDNTAPRVGADPIQVPSSQTSFGVVSDGYKIPNLFQYISGSVLARSDQSSGQTNYTISMIVNVADVTPAGHYTGDFSAVVIPTY